jgi:hypothetical protein
MNLNDKPNCQVSRILKNPRPILSDSSDSLIKNQEYARNIEPTKQNHNYDEKNINLSLRIQ